MKLLEGQSHDQPRQKSLKIRKFLPLLSLLSPYLLARGVTLPLVPLYFEKVGLSILQIGIAFSVFGASLLVFEITWGYLVDHIGPNQTLPPMIGLTTLSYILFAFTRSFGGLILLQVLLGLALSGIAIVARLYFTELSEQSERGNAFGILGATFSLTSFVGSPIGGILGSIAGFENSFYVASATSAISFVPYIYLTRVFKKRPGGVHEIISGSQVGGGSEDQQRLGWAGFIMLGVIAVSIFMGWGFFTSLMPLVVTETPSISGSVIDVGIMLAVFNLATGLLQPVMGSVGSRRPRPWIVGGLIANGAVFFLLTQAHNMVMVNTLTAVEGSCFSTISPLSLSLLTRGLSADYVGRAMGWYGAAEDVGLILGPFLGGIAWSAWGIDSAFEVIGSIFLIVVASYFIMVHWKARFLL